MSAEPMAAGTASVCIVCKTAFPGGGYLVEGLCKDCGTAGVLFAAQEAHKKGKKRVDKPKGGG